MIRISFFFVSLSIALSSCSDYNEVVKSDDYKRKLQVANEYYDSGITPIIKKNGKQKVKKNTILRSVTLYEQIYQRMPKTGEGELAYFRIGKGYYLAGDYYTGGYYLGQFSQRFPYSVKAEEALFLSAMCSVNNSPDHTLDQQETKLAINDLQQFVDRFPNSYLVDSCNHIIDRLHSKLVQKDYEAVIQYAQTERFRAAVSSAETYLEDHPMSKHEEEVNFLLVENSYLLAKNSVDTKKVERIENTIERYRNFVGLFPESKYIKTLEGYNDSMTRELEKLKKD
jgi:outer membrane protein assembly factor BamD